MTDDSYLKFEIEKGVYRGLLLYIFINIYNNNFLSAEFLPIKKTVICHLSQLF